MPAAAPPDDVTVTVLNPEEPGAIVNAVPVVQVHPAGHVVGVKVKLGLGVQAALSLLVTVTVYDNPVPANAL